MIEFKFREWTLMHGLLKRVVVDRFGGEPRQWDIRFARREFPKCAAEAHRAVRKIQEINSSKDFKRIYEFECGEYEEDIKEFIDLLMFSFDSQTGLMMISVNKCTGE